MDGSGSAPLYLSSSTQSSFHFLTSQKKKKKKKKKDCHFIFPFCNWGLASIHLCFRLPCSSGQMTRNDSLRQQLIPNLKLLIIINNNYYNYSIFLIYHNYNSKIETLKTKFESDSSVLCVIFILTYVYNHTRY